LLDSLAPRAGLEPATYGLTVGGPMLSSTQMSLILFNYVSATTENCAVINCCVQLRGCTFLSQSYLYSGLPLTHLLLLESMTEAICKSGL